MHPGKVLKLMEVGGKKPRPGLYFLGLYDASITVLDQQTRALNLAWALSSSGLLHSKSRVAIIGAGAAGLTFAAAAERLGASPALVEKGTRPFAVFFPQEDGSLCSRYVHPRIARWPQSDWHRGSADLPIGNWEANPPCEVARLIFKNTLANSPLPIYCESTVHHLRTAGTEKWHLNWSGVPTAAHAIEESLETKAPLVNSPTKLKTLEQVFDLVVLAVGYGEEAKVEGAGTLSYWRANSEPSSDHDGEKLLFVSGTGEGGVADALHYLGIPLDASFAQELKELEENPDITEQWLHFARSLRRLDTKVERSSGEKLRNLRTREEIERALADPEVKGFVDALRQRLDRKTDDNREVIFGGRGSGLLSKKKSVLHCVLLLLLEEIGRVTYRHGELLRVEPAKEGVTLFLKGEDAPVPLPVPIAVARHGPQAPSEKCCIGKEVIRAREALKQKNEIDLTRHPYWPQGFFGKEAADHQEKIDNEIVSAAIRSVKQEVKLSRPTRQGPNPHWVDLAALFTLSGVAIKKDLFIEHEVTQTPPFNLSLDRVSATPREAADRLVVESGAEHSVPEWAEAYLLRPDPNSQEPIDLELVLSGRPATATWLSDGIGFPVYTDMSVEKISLSVECSGVKPIRPQVFVSVFRRRAYSVMTEESTVVHAKNLTVNERNGLDFVWPDDLAEETDALRTPEGLRGHFIGIRWERLEPVP